MSYQNNESLYVKAINPIKSADPRHHANPRYHLGFKNKDEPIIWNVDESALRLHSDNFDIAKHAAEKWMKYNAESFTGKYGEVNCAKLSRACFEHFGVTSYKVDHWIWEMAIEISDWYEEQHWKD